MKIDHDGEIDVYVFIHATMGKDGRDEVAVVEARMFQLSLMAAGGKRKKTRKNEGVCTG